jgi:hypothetical protein
MATAAGKKTTTGPDSVDVIPTESCFYAIFRIPFIASNSLFV